MIAGLAKPVEYPQIHITTYGKTTTAVKTLNGKVVDKVTAKLHPYDEFDFDKGAEIAIDRLLNPKCGSMHNYLDLSYKKGFGYPVGEKNRNDGIVRGRTLYR